MAKVVPLASAKAFLEALEKSGLLSAQDMEALQARGDDEDPKLIARDLLREGKLTKWQAGQLLHGFHQLIVSKYKLMDQLGSGEMGRVYLAEHAQMGRRVSLKILSRKHTTQPEILRRFLEDARRVSALDHRNLAHIYDVNSEDERYFVVTEFVEGKDLQKLVESSGATAPSQACDFVRQAAEGLAHAHERNVVHGDLKPSNLLVDAQGIVKILDLGLARLTQAPSATDGEESSEMATPATQSFHAPEQAGGKQDVTPRADIYSLGAILYFLLSGKAPLGRVKSAEDVSQACPAASDELAELCAQMLAEDPAKRPASAAEAIARLQAAAKARPKEATAKRKSEEEPAKPAKQRKVLVAKPLEVAAPPPIPLPEEQPAPIPLPTESIQEITADELVARSEPTPSVEPAASNELVPSAEPAPSAEEDPFGGFAIQTKRRKKPAAAAGVAAAGATSANQIPPAPAASGKSNLPLVIGGAIGGGVLALGLMAGLVYFLFFRGGDEKESDKNVVAKVETKETKSDATAATSEANPEANPEVNPEVNPPPATSPTTPDPGATKTPATSPNPATPGTTVPGPATTPTPMVTTPMPATPMPATPTPATPTPMPKPEPAKNPPMPAPPVAPVGNPFEGFAPTVALPPLEEKGKVVANATAPKVLGTIKLPPKAICIMSLKGGDFACKGKQKFELKAGNNETSERDWDFKLVPDGTAAPTIIARLSLQNDQLTFQWTDDATKQLAVAPHLCNCVLEMSAGTGTHRLTLRQPVTGEPLVVNLEKPMSAKWTIDYPPNPKEIAVEIGPLEGKFPKFKLERPEITALKDSTTLLTGLGDDALILQFKIDSSMTAKVLQITAAPQFQIHGMSRPEKYMKTTLVRLIPGTEQANAEAMARQIAVNNNKMLNEAQKAALGTQIDKEVRDTATQKSQALQLKSLVEDLQGKGTIHFHIYYSADDVKVDLLTTSAAAPAPKGKP